MAPEYTEEQEEGEHLTLTASLVGEKCMYTYRMTMCLVQKGLYIDV